MARISPRSSIARRCVRRRDEQHLYTNIWWHDDLPVGCVVSGTFADGRHGAGLAAREQHAPAAGGAHHRRDAQRRLLNPHAPRGRDRRRPDCPVQQPRAVHRHRQEQRGRNAPVDGAGRAVADLPDRQHHRRRFVARVPLRRSHGAGAGLRAGGLRPDGHRLDALAVHARHALRHELHGRRR